jgi:hypothetical protein
MPMEMKAVRIIVKILKKIVHHIPNKIIGQNKNNRKKNKY